MTKTTAPTHVSSGIGFPGLLTIVFITLKIIGTISWSWVWVLCPLWLPLAIVLVVLFGALCLAGLTMVFSK